MNMRDVLFLVLEMRTLGNNFCMTEIKKSILDHKYQLSVRRSTQVMSDETESRYCNAIKLETNQQSH